MASIREIKRRRETIQNTEQITKAMKLVSTAKLQRSRGKAESAGSYSELMYETVRSVILRSDFSDNPWLRTEDQTDPAVVVITSNRGLAGGYNSNIVKLVTNDGRFLPERTRIYAVGRKGKEALQKKGYKIIEDYSEAMWEPLYTDASELAASLLNAYRQGVCGSVYLAYTSFQNTVTHVPVLVRLLPLTGVEETKRRAVPEPELVMNYEPDEETVLSAVIPQYLGSLIYGALLESVASEHGARMAAMDSASGNAQEMMQDLALKYNRARQGAITQELTEIIAGANAIS